MTRTGIDNAARARGFTLTELLVAVAIVALLTLAIGRIFRSISGIVSLGSANAEVDQLARTIERQLRDDVDAFNRMRAEDTFLVIRMREIGDANHNGAVDSDEQALYLSREDRDADIRDGIAPYAPGSRAVTRRVDDMSFLGLAGAGGSYQSVQIDHNKTPGDVTVRTVPAVRTEVARIYWGHALRPAPDPVWPPPNAGSPGAPKVPVRQYYADGDFGARPSSVNDLGLGVSNVVSPAARNEYSADWLVVRQPTLLYGGTAAGYSRDGGRSVAPIGNGREFAPYIRDVDTRIRLGGGIDEDPSTVANETDLIRLYNQNYPEVRLMSWGRVDICAQDDRDVRRWLEGETPAWTPTSGTQPGAVPFSGGVLQGEQGGNGADPTFTLINSPLWQRVWSQQPNPVPNTGDRLRENLRGLRSALLGVMARPLAEGAPPELDRQPTSALVQPEDGLMDIHATIATHCSDFEIAWSDGSTALHDVELNGNASDGPEIRRGDLVWFDISLVNPSDRDTRSSYRWWWDNHQRDVNFVGYRPDRQQATQVADLPQWPFPLDFPEIYLGQGGSVYEPSDPNLLNRVFAAPGSGPSGAYYPRYTGGAPRASQREYLAVWGYRVPDDEGSYTVAGGDSRAWRKNLLIRVRMTLHDSQKRLKDGKAYEFVFRLNPSS